MTMPELFQYVITGVFVVVWYLLRQKDSRQQKEFDDYKIAQAKIVETLFARVDNLKTDLQNHRLEIASNHYEAKTIDVKFDKLETTFKDGFRDLSTKFDKFFTMYAESLHNGTGKFPTHKD